MTASTLSSTFMSKSSAASLEINAVTMQGTFASTLIIAVKPSFSTPNEHFSLQTISLSDFQLNHLPILFIS
jgi:hypothetical protein